jgi:hypothetical protein
VPPMSITSAGRGCLMLSLQCADQAIADIVSNGAAK